MIEAFIGLVGGGKSLNSVRRMCAYMARGGRVASNIYLKGFCRLSCEFCASSPLLSYLRSLGWEYQSGQYTYISFDDMAKSAEWFHRVPAGVSRDKRTLLVIDESTDLFDSLDRDRVRADSVYRELFRFLRLSRHAHIDVLFICQDLAALNSRVRGLVGTIWRSTDMKKFRLAKIPIPFPFDLFMLQQFNRKGTTELKREWIRKDPRVFKLYFSEAFAGDIGVKWDGRAIGDGRIDIQKKGFSMFYKFLIFVNCICLCFLVWKSFFKEEEEKNVSETVGTSVDVQKPDEPSVRVVYGTYSYGRVGNKKIISFGGKALYEGIPSEWGTVLTAMPSFAICRGINGNTVWLMPLKPKYIEPIDEVSPKKVVDEVPDAAAPSPTGAV